MGRIRTDQTDRSEILKTTSYQPPATSYELGGVCVKQGAIDGFDDQVEFVQAHGGVEGEGDLAQGDFLGAGQALLAVALAEVGEGVDGGVVDAGLDAGLAQVDHEGLALDPGGEEDGEDVVGGLALFRGGERQADAQLLQGGEGLPVGMDQVAAALVVVGELFQLLQAEGGADLIDAVVVAEVQHVIGEVVALVAVVGQAGHAVGALEADGLGQIVIIRHEHAAFAGGEILVGEETEDADLAPGAEGFTVQETAGGMGDILDDGQVVPLRDRHDFGQAAGEAGVVHDDDGFGAGGDGGLDGGGVDGQVVGAEDVGEADVRAAMQGGVGGGDKGEGGDDDFVTGADAEGEAGQVQAFGGVGDGEGVFGAGEGDEFGFEVLGDFTHGEPAGADDAEDGCFLFGAEIEIC